MRRRPPHGRCATALLLALLSAAQGCGQKGALYLPQKAQPAQPQAPAATTPTTTPTPPPPPAQDDQGQ
jgi:predicted small lipoprotein YifL